MKWMSRQSRVPISSRSSTESPAFSSSAAFGPVRRKDSGPVGRETTISKRGGIRLAYVIDTT
jgi:hypothetical protein